MEDLKMAIATIETQLDEVRNALKQLEEQPTPKVETPWYDFTEEQQQQLGRIVKEFINKVVGDLGSTDVHLREGGIEVSVEVDLAYIVEDEIPYGIDNDFIEYLNDEITEQREEQQQDCEESN
jgi:hypothetical protein